MEVSEPMVQAAEAHAIPGARFIHGDILSIELQPESFDVVLCMHNVVDELHPRSRRGLLFTRIRTWLAREGFLVFSSHVLRPPVGGPLPARYLAHLRGWGYLPERYHGRTVWQYRSRPGVERRVLRHRGLAVDREWPDYSRRPPDWIYYRARVREGNPDVRTDLGGRL